MKNTNDKILDDYCLSSDNVVDTLGILCSNNILRIALKTKLAVRTADGSVKFSKSMTDEFKSKVKHLYYYPEIPDATVSGDIVCKLYSIDLSYIRVLVDSGAIGGIIQGSRVSEIRLREIVCYFEKIKLLFGKNYSRDEYNLTFEDVCDILRINIDQLNYITNREMLNVEYEGSQRRYSTSAVMELSKYCLTTMEIADLLDKAYGTVGNYASYSKKYDYIRVGKELRINIDDVKYCVTHTISRLKACELLGINVTTLRRVTRENKLDFVIGIDGKIWYSNDICDYVMGDFSITVRDSLRILHTSMRGLNRLVDSGELPYKVDICGRLRFRKEDLIKIAEGKNK